MKTTFKYGVATALTMILLFGTSSCRKGEEDPFFSIIPRGKRIGQEWFVNSGEIHSTTVIGNNTSQSISVYSRSSVEIHQGGQVDLWTGSYIWHLNDEKDQFIEHRQEYRNANDQNIQIRSFYQGEWEWMKKGDEFKNKERIEATYALRNFSSPFGFQEFTSLHKVEYEIYELRKDQMQIKFTEIEERNDSTTITHEGHLTLYSVKAHGLPN